MLTFYLSLIDDDESKTRFEQLYLTHQHTMMGVAVNILKDFSLAEDAVHDAFLRIIKNWENIFWEDCNKTRSLVVIIVRHIALDYIKKRNRFPEIDLDEYEECLQDDQLDPEEAFLGNEGRQRIVDALGRLKQNYADILALHATYGMNDKAIAGFLAISPENARIQLHRGRAQLAKILKADD